jgi:hypothetical protein
MINIDFTSELRIHVSSYGENIHESFSDPVTVSVQADSLDEVTDKIRDFATHDKTFSTLAKKMIYRLCEVKRQKEEQEQASINAEEEVEA